MSRIDDEIEKVFKYYKPNSLQDLVKKAKCKILYFDLDDETGGCTIVNNKCKTIIVNQNWNYAYQQFVIAHEFAHIRLHSGASTPFYRGLELNRYVNKMEREANMMAMQLLLKLNPGLYEFETKYDILTALGLSEEFEEYVY